MNQIIEKSFDNVTEQLDGNQYVRCTFKNCMLVYAGGPLPALEECSWTNCHWQLSDAGQRTIQFLTGLYRIGDDVQKQSIERVLRGIVGQS
jgi:hypothetical protein